VGRVGNRRQSRVSLTRAIFTLIAALATTAAVAAPAGAATQQAGHPSSQSTPGYPESHLWTFGASTVLGFRYPTPQPIHGLPTGARVTGAAFGPNNEFLLNNGTVWTVSSPTPSEVPGLSGIISISSASSVLYSLSPAGDVYAWTGTGSATQVTGVSGVISIVNGLALESNGTVWTLSATSATQVPVPVAVTQVSSNNCGGSAYALTSSGRIYAWGANNDGQLGNGTRTSSTTPVLVNRVKDAAQVISGCSNAYAILNGTGSVMAWGLGTQGELGNGHRYISTVAVPVSTITGVTQLVAGYETTYALEGNGTVWDWGYGLGRELGYPQSYSAVPGQVPGFGVPIISVFGSDTGYREQNFAVALGNNGTIWGPWGGIGSGPSDQVTRTPPFAPATGLWCSPGGLGYGYGAACYIAD
jgi:alpha-tubulin suppressor-like RCC1 family protein